MAKGKIKIINNQAVRLYYSEGKCHFLGLNNRPFVAITNGKKRIEIRTNIEQIDFDFNQCKPDDCVVFINESTGEKTKKKIKRIIRYRGVEELFNNEDVEKILSSGKNAQEGINSILELEGYREGIKKNGVWAIELK